MKELFAAASVCALLIAAPAWAQNTTGQGTAGSESSTSQSATGAASLSQQDRNFVQHAGAGNLAEATAGKLASERAATPAIREFGRWMYTDHGLVA